MHCIIRVFKLYKEYHYHVRVQASMANGSIAGGFDINTENNDIRGILSAIRIICIALQ